MKLANRKRIEELEKVCKPDPKTKKEVCKTIKVHKKVEGDKVPDSTKKK